VAGTGRFCGPVVLDGIFKYRIEQQLQANKAPDAAEATPDDVHELRSQLWHERI
jgi:hypothetical protein